MINHNIFNKIIDKVALINWKQKITNINLEYHNKYAVYTTIDNRFGYLSKHHIRVVYNYRHLYNENYVNVCRIVHNNITKVAYLPPNY